MHDRNKLDSDVIDYLAAMQDVRDRIEATKVKLNELYAERDNLETTYLRERKILAELTGAI